MKLINFTCAFYWCGFVTLCYCKSETYNDEELWNIFKSEKKYGNKFKSGETKIDNEKVYILNKVEKIASVPVLYPKDICLFSYKGTTFAAALHSDEKEPSKQQFTIYEIMPEVFEIVFVYPGEFIQSMDCQSTETKAYVALLYETEHINRTTKASPVFEITENTIRPIEYFVRPYQNSVNLRVFQNELFLLQTYNSPTKENVYNCEIYKWSGYRFNPLDNILCQNPKLMEFFVIESQVFIAVANYADNFASSDTFSFIYKFDENTQKFMLHQKIKTSAVFDIKYFYVDSNKHEKNHFLIIGNSLTEGTTKSERNDGSTIIYKYLDENFIPVQQLSLYSSCKFLPVQSGSEKFMLMVACENQEIQLFQYNGMELSKSDVQLTGGSLGKGISNLRSYQDQNEVYIVVSNKNMVPNDTNIYLPRYKEITVTNLKSTIFEWYKNIYDELSKVDVAQLSRRIRKLAKMKSGLPFLNENIDWQEANIQKATVKLFHYAKNNMTRRFWKRIFVAESVIDEIEKKIMLLIESDSTLSSIKNPNNEDLLSSLDSPIKFLRMNELRVNENIDFDMINNQTKDKLYIKNIKSDDSLTKNTLSLNDNTRNPYVARNKQVSQSFVQIEARSIKVLGQINEIGVSKLNEKFLKTNGDQIFTAACTCQRFKTDNIEVNKLINGDSISQLVLTSGGNFIVNQDILFAKPIYAQHVIINNRLNNIHVLQGELQVLHTNVPRWQTISSNKIFENVHLLEPIALQGQIKSASLETMNPVSTLNTDVVLEGDYIISGLVTINDLLSSYNIYNNLEDGNILKLFREGIQKDSSEIDLNLSFVHAIRAKNITVASINNQFSSEFVKTKTDDIQDIKGRKVFTSDLRIHKGFCNSREINGINIDVLKNTILRKSGDQNVTGVIHFKRIKVPRLSTHYSTLLGATPIDSILTASSKQDIYSNMMIQDLKTMHLKAFNLSITGNVFGVNLKNLVQDSVHYKDNANIFGHKKFQGNFIIENLLSQKNVNLVPFGKISETISLLIENHEIKGPVKFALDIFLSNFSFSGKINGISKIDFGSNWLLTEFDQTFTTKQVFSLLRYKENLLLNGRVNDQQLETLSSNTYWINKEERVKNMIFGNNVFVYGSLISDGKINSIDFANDVILTESAQPQEIRTFVSCTNMLAKNIKQILNFNNVNLEHIQNFVNNQSEHMKVTIKNAVFDKIPIMENVNKKDMKEMLATVWFTDQNVVLKKHFQFNEIQFGGSFLFDELINGVDFVYLAQNYFSLSTPQNILTDIHIKNDVTFEDMLNVQKLNISGSITDLRSGLSMNLDHFVANTLTKDSEQEIVGTWNIYEVVVPGHINNILINNLNFVNDVMRYDAPINNITATKYFDNVSSYNLRCELKSKVNNVYIREWIEKSAFVYGNYTIQGTTTFETAIIHNNADVLGLVNNIKFSRNTILLNSTDQTINGNVDIVTKYPKDNRILTLIFENLSIRKFNGLEIIEFFKCLANNQNNYINGQLIFKTFLNVNNLDNNEKLFDINSKDFLQKCYMESKIANKLRSLHNLESLSKRLTEIEDKTNVVYRFENIQNIPKLWKKVIKFTLNITSSFKEYLAVLENGNENCIIFYAWDPIKKNLINSEDLLWCTNEDGRILEINKISFQYTDVIYIRMFLKNTGQYQINFLINVGMYLESIAQMISYADENITPIKLNNETCFVLYSENTISFKVVCLIFTNGHFELNEQGYLQMNTAKMALNIGDSLVLVLPTNYIEIWYPYKKYIPQQVIPSGSITMITSAIFQSYKYIAVGINHGITNFIEIYRSAPNEEFRHLQTIEIDDPIEIKLSVLNKSKDLILYALKRGSSDSLMIYSFTGISGFIEIGSIQYNSNSQSINDFEIDGHQFLCIISDKVNLLEILFKFV